MEMVLHLESGYGRVAQVVKVSGNIGRSEAKTEVTKVIFATTERQPGTSIYEGSVAQSPNSGQKNPKKSTGL